jgi:virginiamycin B lyase
VIQGPDKAAWLTDGGLNAIVRVGWPDRSVRVYPLPAARRGANLNTASFDHDGDLWFTGQAGVVGKLAVKSGNVSVKDAPRGTGPYGSCTTQRARLVVLARRLVHRRIDRVSGDSTIVERRRRNREHAASGAIASRASGSASG